MQLNIAEYQIVAGDVMEQLYWENLPIEYIYWFS